MDENRIGDPKVNRNETGFLKFGIGIITTIRKTMGR
jgi:hypothetical protein